MNLRERLRRIFLATTLGALALVAAAFLVDYGILRIRIAINRTPYDSVTVTHYYAVLQKNGKTEFLFDPPQPQTCVNSLFPHQGSSPCWYLKRHPEQRTDI